MQHFQGYTLCVDKNQKTCRSTTLYTILFSQLYFYRRFMLLGIYFSLAYTPPYPAKKNQASQQACQSARLLHATDEKACKQRHCCFAEYFGTKRNTDLK
jgi:hypothetical protein